MISSQIAGTYACTRQEGFRILVGALQLVLLQQSLYGPVSAPLLHRAEKLTTCHSLGLQQGEDFNLIMTWIVF